MKKQPWCIVLSGGGAKGVYHVGVWKALRQLHIQPTAFIGNSIGAIMAACMAQNAWTELNQIVDNINIGSFFRLPDKLVDHGVLSFKRADKDAVLRLYRSLSHDKGFDTAPLRKLLCDVIDEAKLRRSGIDLGVVTVNVSDLQPCQIFLEDMSEGALVDYLMASSALPGFKPLMINKKQYLDGGLFDNMPFTMARERGYTNIIVVDISGLGLVRKFDTAGCRVVYIKNSIQMGSILDFTPDFIRDYRRLGYLDTMKTFGRLTGLQYFLKPQAKLEARFAQWLAELPAPARERFSRLFPAQLRTDRRKLLKLLEAAAVLTGINRINIYTYARLAGMVERKRLREDQRVSMFIEENGRTPTALFEELVVQPLHEKRFEESVYYYYRLIDELAAGPVKAMLRKILESVCPLMDAGLYYFEVQKEFRERLKF
ncbi:MAG: patatin-like phospholipase family protein [Spirochaetes bacterium]|nr:patatin-like phospholipase family protein [Spirochaetota bacterium]MBU0955364.1 patatin-like phospholipase family protein [Spirochaetota bacterium]